MKGNMFRIVMDRAHTSGDHYQGRLDLWAVKSSNKDDKESLV